MNFRVESDLPKPRAAVREHPVDWEGAKQALISNPGQWVLVAEDVHASTGEQLRKGKYTAFPKSEIEDYEFSARKPDGSNYAARRTDIWGRYTKPVGKLWGKPKGKR